jgi:flavin-dependent dehydrogenase
MAEVCVIGAGPAGCVFAARMAQLGHEVRLIEREAFPRSRLGESLSPGIQPLLVAARLEGAIDASRARRVRSVWVDWEDGPRRREDAREQGLIVDRGAFDLALVERARAFGVEVLQPTRVVDQRRVGGQWRLAVEGVGRRETLAADFVADAGGRARAAPRLRRQTGAQTLAVYAYWRGARLPNEPRIAAGDEAWFWGVPLPNGTYNTLAFVDPKSFRAEAGGLTERFLARLAQSPLMRDCRDVELIGVPRAIDATPYIASDCVSRGSIQLGDAALAIDPISSSGVQKAIQSGLTGAVVANTLLRRPGSADLAIAFYLSQLNDASESHRRWAADHYGTVARARGGPFWTARASDRQEAAQPPPEAVDVGAMTVVAFELSPDAALVETPCLDGEFVSAAPALCHPRLARPVAYLGGWKLAPLLRSLPPGCTPIQIARSWSDALPLESGLAIAGWLVSHGVLVKSAGPLEGRP